MVYDWYMVLYMMEYGTVYDDYMVLYVMGIWYGLLSVYGTFYDE